MILERIFGFHDENIDQHAIITNFFAIPAIIIYVLALLDKRKNHYNGVITYKQGFITGLIITVIITVISPVTQIITTSVITPDYFPNMIEYSVSEGLMTQSEAEGNFNTGSYVLQTIFGTLVMGIITSAVVAIFTKRKAA
jgi:hypothetical protein